MLPDQETAENLLLFSMDIGNEMQKIEKATPNNNPFHENDANDKLVKKSDAIHEMGFTDRQARDFQTMAKHPETVEKAREAQEIAEAVLDAETKLGELTSKMQKAANQYSAKDSAVHSTKAEKLQEIGITEKQKQRYEALAAHPDTVEKAKADARAEGTAACYSLRWDQIGRKGTAARGTLVLGKRSEIVSPIRKISAI